GGDGGHGAASWRRADRQRRPRDGAAADVPLRRAEQARHRHRAGDPRHASAAAVQISGDAAAPGPARHREECRVIFRRKQALPLRPSDLQLDADSGSRFLPWALAVMVFLAALALAGALALDGSIDDWRRGVSSRLTVQIADRPGETSEEHTSELQSRENIVCRLLLEKL